MKIIDDSNYYIFRQMKFDAMREKLANTSLTTWSNTLSLKDVLQKNFIHRKLFEQQLMLIFSLIKKITKLQKLHSKSSVFILKKRTTLINLNEMNSATKHQSWFKGVSLKHGLSFLSISKRYPVLKKAPILYPFSFIQRFFME